MKRFFLTISILILFTLFWLGLVIDVAYYYFDEGLNSLLFKNLSLQFKVIYILGILLNLGYLTLLVFKKNRNFL